MATHPGGLITKAAPAVRTRRLVRKFGDRVILKELDLTVAPGSSPPSSAAADRASPPCCGP